MSTDSTLCFKIKIKFFIVKKLFSCFNIYILNKEPIDF